MKTITSLLGILVVAAFCATHADAATHKKKRRHANPTPNASATVRDKDDDATGYYEHRLEAVRFGSKRWWTIYNEQSGGQRD
jgi:hypothetical protein